MLAILRCRVASACGRIEFGRPFQRDAAYRRLSSSNYYPPTAFSSANLMGGSIRSLSTGEVVVQDTDPPPSSPKKASAAAATTATSTTMASQSASASDMSQPQAWHIIRDKSKNDERALEDVSNQRLTDLQRADELFHQICTEARALLRNNRNSTTSDEVVAMADYFMILVNSLDLERSLEVVQSLQMSLHENQVEERGESELLRRGPAVEEKLRHATKSMSQLHHVFITMVESCLPQYSLPEELEVPKKVAGSNIPPLKKELYSPRTVGRALHLSRRAEELGMPMHRPLYQRLAMGTVITSSPAGRNSKYPTDDLADPKPSKSTCEPVSLTMPGQIQRMKEGLNPPPLSLELLDTFQQARSAMKITRLDQLHRLAGDLFAAPFLMLMKQKQYDECMGLLRGWHGLFSGHERRIDLLDLLGENHTIDALEVVHGWLDCPTSADDARKNPHVMELTGLLEASASAVLKDKKERAEKLSQLLWQFSLRNDSEDDGYEHDSDSDSDFDDDDFDFVFDGNKNLDTPTMKSTPVDLSIVGNGKAEPLYFSNAKDTSTGTISIAVDESNASGPEHEDGSGTKESTIIKGLTDEEARRSIYLRNGVDWVLPDLVPQLQDWNKGSQLTFTPEFERYLGHQISKEDNGDTME